MSLKIFRSVVRKWRRKNLHCIKINDVFDHVQLKVAIDEFTDWDVDESFQRTGSECEVNVQLLSVKKINLEDSTILPSCSANYADSEEVLKADHIGTSRRNLLMIIIANDRLNCLKSYLKSDASALSTVIEGYSLLHVAALKGSDKCLQYILKRLARKAKKDLRRKCDEAEKSVYGYLIDVDKNGETLLHLACRSPTEACFKIVCRAIIKRIGWDSLKEMLMVCNSAGQNPLHIACLCKNYKILNLLVTNRFEKTILRNFSNITWNHTLLRRDVKEFRATFASTLLNYQNNGTVLHELARAHCKCFKSQHRKNLKAQVCGSGCNFYPASFKFSKDDIDVPEGRCDDCESVVQKILDLTCRVAPELVTLRRRGNISLLMDAVTNDSIAMVTTLLRLGVDVEEEDLEGRTALHYAANYGLSEQIAVLLSNGASALYQDQHGVTPIHLAALYGFTASLRLLYTASNLSDISTSAGYTAFLWSAYYGVEASLKTFLSLNSDVDRNQVDNEGCTALHLSASQGHIRCAELLLKEKWEIEARNLKGATPLLLSAKTGQLETARALVEHGASTRAKDADGNTYVHLSAGTELSGKEFRKLLLMVPAFELINSQNLTGQTPLHIAIEVDSYDHVVELVKLGASSRIKNKDGWDSFMCAIRYGCKNIITFLLRCFPNVNCYSSITGYSTLSVAVQYGDTQLISQLKSRGAKMPKEILYDAAVKIQRWYRRQILIKKMCCRGRRTSEKVRQACVRLSSSMFDAGFEVRCIV